MTLEKYFLKLKQETNYQTLNPLLNSFDQLDLSVLDIEASSDAFIAEKKNTILKLIKDIKTERFEPKLKSAFDEYCEGLTYLKLKAKFDRVERIKEGKEKTPDFKISYTSYQNGDNDNYVIFAELKSMSFANGNINYQNTMNQGHKAHVEIEKQIKKGNKVAFGITEVQPLLKFNKKNYDPYSTKYAIEILIEKIEQNLKAEQFSLGDTVLIVDLKQLTLPSNYIEGGVPVFQEKQYNSNVSGVQWNATFGKIGQLVYKKIEFEGTDNIDGELEREGILISRNWIKAICFQDYFLNAREPKVVGLYRKNEVTDGVLLFLNKFCDFVNDDKNSNGWRLNHIDS